jgi:hypothetical protein
VLIVVFGVIYYNEQNGELREIKVGYLGFGDEVEKLEKENQKVHKEKLLLLSNEAETDDFDEKLLWSKTYGDVSNERGYDISIDKN